MKTKQLPVKTNVRTGAVRCTRNTYPYLLCYIGKKQNGAPEPHRESAYMSPRYCLNMLMDAPSDDYACYVA